MRLLRWSSSSGRLVLRLEEFFGDAIPVYSILSHTWSSEGEVLFADIQSGAYDRKAGIAKVRGAIMQAQSDGYDYIWIDTCCIDKSSSAELSEAINSMYAWYQRADICYAYLVDVRNPTDHEVYPSTWEPVLDGTVQTYERVVHERISKSRWWTRGWTLQELLAPEQVEFFSFHWDLLGDRVGLADLISEITDIDVEYLDNSRPIQNTSIAKRMSFASRRTTTREEDMTYCLLGIFSVQMPLLYGEGGASFIRLQEEIIRKSDDHSIFAWKAEMPLPTSGILAQHPSFFASSGSLRPLDDWEPRQPYSMTNMGLGIDLPLRDLEQDASNHGVLCIAALACVHPQQPSQRLCIYLTALSASSNQFARTYADEWTYQATPSEARRIYIRQIPTSQHRAAPLTWQTFKLGAVEILEGHCANARGTLHLDLDSYEQSKEKGATYLGLLSSPGRHLYSGFRNRIVYSDMSHSLLQSWFVFATQDHSAHIIILFGLLSKEQLGFTVVKQTRAFIRSEARDMACWHLGALKPTGIWIKVQLLQKVLWVQPDARLREEPTKTAHYVRVTATRRQGQNLAFDISATIRTVEGPALAELTRPPEPHQYGRSLATCLDSARCLDEPSTDCIAHEEILNGLAESELLHAL